MAMMSTNMRMDPNGTARRAGECRLHRPIELQELPPAEVALRLQQPDIR